MTDILILINRLPPELKRYIYFYVPIAVKLRLTKDNYTTFYYRYIFCNIKDQITYARKLISYNLYFQFELFIAFFDKNLHKNKKIYYSNKKYNSLYELFSTLCIKYQSTNCRNILRYKLGH
jgi:hypothetical protein